MSSGILIVVCIDAGLPIMLYTDWAPECLELVHEEVIRQGSWPLKFLLFVQQRGSDFIAAVGKGTGVAATAAGHIGIGGAEPVLVDLWVIQGSSCATSPPKGVALSHEVHRWIALLGSWCPDSAKNAPIGITVQCIVAQFLLTMREAADFLAPTVTVVAQFGLVLSSVVGDFLARVGEGTEIAGEAFLPLGNSVA
jgi:hypothetical protein